MLEFHFIDVTVAASVANDTSNVVATELDLTNFGARRIVRVQHGRLNISLE